jgi:hypothetical protein
MEKRKRTQKVFPLKMLLNNERKKWDLLAENLYYLDRAIKEAT